MTPEKIKQALDEVAKIILNYNGCESPVEERLSEDKMMKNVEDLKEWEIIYHLHFMTQEGKRLVDQGRIAKSHRWLGFLQGALWGLGITSIVEQKNINRPDDVAYDGKRI